ncbi:glycosyltransferase [Isoptericola sp. b441]|uniref:Glycosyltransferase n=1 Tax=Actinotalea lenta TaxID=3064654 RepID=A0ABT9D5E6_9CELL|nr:glycosyltransferase [Isoptericola sp. b441]MDO8106007.1 glycosyltransferase [Isoptericola sp. b441]
MVAVTVVVCAYTLDRWQDLVASVRSAAAQQPTPDELVLVVDHNPELLERASRELQPEIPGLEVIANERRKGLSGARNTALERASGEVVVFLDDDASASDGWLASLLEPYGRPDVLGVGGSAAPRWPTGLSRPATLPEGSHGRGVLDWVVGCTYEGQPLSQAPVRNLMGCNMSMRVRPALDAGGFSEDLGRVGRTPLGCEETELCIRMQQRRPDGRFLFEPSASVRHRVSPDRLTWSYLLHRGYAEGLSKATVAGQVGQDQALETERGYVARVLPGAVLRGLGRAVRGPGRRNGAEGAAAVVACLAATAAGYARGRVAAATGRTSFASRPALGVTAERSGA